MATHGKDAPEVEKKRLKQKAEELRAQVARYSAMSQHPSCSPMDKARYRVKMRESQASLRLAMRAQRLLVK